VAGKRLICGHIGAFQSARDIRVSLRFVGKTSSRENPGM